MIYKKLGKHIQQVNLRNRDLGVDTLLGVSITKKLIPSIANTIGTDMSVYKIIEKRQFAYGTVTSRNGEKISIALADEHEKALVSQIYVVFEVIDTNVLLPEYLMMWFSRPEFDRYARFHSHGSTRETFDWADLCDTELPIPSIEKQRELVAQYQSISNKIKVNEQICEKLEATAQALYRQWFVDFEFPNEQGESYKSSGGVMMFDEELGKEIPEGWVVRRLEEITNQICVGFVGSVYDYYCDENEGIPMIRTTDIKEDGIDYSSLKYITKEFHNKNKKSQLKNGDLLVARHGSNGMPVIFHKNEEANCLNAIIIKPDTNMAGSKLIYCFITSKETIADIKSSVSGSVQEVLNTRKLADIKIILPKKLRLIKSLDYNLSKIENYIELNRIKVQKLTRFQSLLLSGLATLD